jgi:hypothetical protein
MAGLVPAIHVVVQGKRFSYLTYGCAVSDAVVENLPASHSRSDVESRDKPGHDGNRFGMTDQQAIQGPHAAPGLLRRKGSSQ